MTGPFIDGGSLSPEEMLGDDVPEVNPYSRIFSRAVGPDGAKSIVIETVATSAESDAEPLEGHEDEPTMHSHSDVAWHDHPGGDIPHRHP